MTEQPKYTKVKQDGAFELRQYAGYIKAEVRAEGKSYKQAAENGFRVLAAYIFGNNASQGSISMTTPVQAAKSEKIAMTAPVIVSGESEYRIAFIMPSMYSMETLPVPLDGRVALTPVGPQLQGAIRFSGYFNEEKISRNKAKLVAWLATQKLMPDGEFIIAGYNPPWIPGFLSRNEILTNVKPME